MSHVRRWRCWAAAMLAVVCSAWLVAAALGAGPPESAQARLEDGRIYPLGIEIANRAVCLRLVNVSVADAYGNLKPPPGGKLLVLATEWENTIPWTIVREQKVATAYQIPNLADHLYVVANGSRLARILPTNAVPPGHVPVKGFHLSKIGDRMSGNVVFALPADVASPASLELRFYDYSHGNVAAPILGAAPAPGKPIWEHRTNQVVEFGIFGIHKSKQLGEQVAPDGMTFDMIDLRGRSVFQTEGDATAFDPKARPGAKLKVGTVADWTDARRYTQLVVDGEYAYSPLPQSTLGEQPRFLPDVMTGGEVAFLAPEAAQSLELRCDFPNAKLAGGPVVRPDGLTLPIEGTRPAEPERTALGGARDAVFDVAVIGQRARDQFESAKAEAGRQFVVFDMTVKNIGKQQEFFQPKAQIKFVTAAGPQVAYDAASYAGPHPPAEPMYIPAGERRRFELAYRVAARESRPRLAYAAVSAGASKVIALPPLGAEAETK